ncbi:mRNA interferase MazF9 [Corynebacterium sp. BCW_4722]|nr:mRNA interferase MazF9 [Corynebacterium sp. BCW_4722]
MLRGEVRLIDFEPAAGQETNKTRPAVIVSNDTANQLAAIHRGVITVVPLTSNVARVYPFQTFIAGSAAGLRMDSKSQPELTRSVSVSRVGKRVGKLTLQQLLDLDRALRIHLDL